MSQSDRMRCRRRGRRMGHHARGEVCRSSRESGGGGPGATMNHCSLGGYLVSGRAPLPADPTDYDVEALPRRGCNHLRCLTCGAVVRNAQGFWRSKSLSRMECAALYEVADLEASPVLVPASGFRFYVCRCRSWTQTAFEDALDDPDTDPMPQRSNMPWRCDGHPPLELPRNSTGS